MLQRRLSRAEHHCDLRTGRNSRARAGERAAAVHHQSHRPRARSAVRGHRQRSAAAAVPRARPERGAGARRRAALVAADHRRGQPLVRGCTISSPRARCARRNRSSEIAKGFSGARAVNRDGQETLLDDRCRQRRGAAGRDLFRRSIAGPRPVSPEASVSAEPAPAATETPALAQGPELSARSRIGQQRERAFASCDSASTHQGSSSARSISPTADSMKASRGMKWHSRSA